MTADLAVAADGVWTNVSTGVWSDTAKWANGTVAGGGGVATFNAASGTVNITNDMGTVTLSGLAANTNAGNAVIWALVGGTNVMVAPAVVYTRADSLSVRPTTLAGDVDLTITGLGRFFLGDANLYTGRTIISNGNTRVARDSGFGPVPANLRADAIILDNGGLENDDSNFVLTNHLNRGITVTARGGFIGAGYTMAGVQIDSPITGPGFLGINFENSPVTLNNPANDYAGGTVVGTNGPGANPLNCVLKLGQNEVLPDGSGKSGLKIGADSSTNNTLPSSTLDLNGKTETVNTLESGPRAQITSSVSGLGRLIIGGLDEDSVYRGTLTGGATVEKQGAGALYLTEASLSGGTVDVKAGTVLAGGPNLAWGTTMLLDGGLLELTAPSGSFASSANVLEARLLLATNTTLTVDGAAGQVVFAGIVTTNAAADPEPVLTVDNGGAPFLFGSTGTYPATLDASISSAGGLVFTNRVWLRRMPTGSYSIAAGADLALDGTALLGDSALNLSNYSVRLVRSDSVGGDGSVTANAGTTVWFDTMRFASNTLNDTSSNATAYNNQVTLNNGVVGFAGSGTVTYSGAITGTGSAVKTGNGDLLLTGADSSFSGEIQINAGRMLPANETSLGGATVRLNGGLLTNPKGGNLTLATTPVIAVTGGIEVTGAGETMTLNGQVTGVGAVSKWGNGTLALGGTAINTNFDLYARAGTVELAKSGSTTDYAVRNLLGILSNTVVRLTGSNGNQIGGGVTLDGGTLDLNGHSETIGVLTNLVSGGTVTNGGVTAVTLTVGEGGASSAFTGRLTDGLGTLGLTKVGTGTLALQMDAMGYSGGTSVGGGTLRLTFALPVTANLAYRLDATDASKLTLSGSNVTVWADGWTNGVNFSQGTTAQQPVYVPSAINGLPAVRFGYGGSTRLVANKNAIAQTVFIVTRVVTQQSLAGIWGQSVQDKGIRQNNATSWRHTGNGADGGDFSLNGEMYIDGAYGCYFTNNPLHVLTVVSTTNQTWTMAIGDYWNSSTYNRYFKGDIGEVLVYSSVLSTNDRQKVEAYLRNKWFGGLTLPASQPVTVGTGARLAVQGMNLTIGSLSGGGTVAPETGNTVTLADYVSFTGAVGGVGTVAMRNASGTDGLFVPKSATVTVRNDGTQDAVLRVMTTATNTFFGSVQNGSNTLGIVYSGSGMTYFAGTNSTYTGKTIIENGTAIVGGVFSAKYIRFYPQTTRSYGGFTGTGYQLSEFQLMLNGVKVDYPAGTLATSEGMTFGAEGPEKAIDGLTSTKVYRSSLPLRPLVLALPDAVLFDGYRWYTANDSTGRDPVAWTVDVSDDGVIWTSIDAQDYSANQSAITETRYALVGMWMLSDVASMNVFSDVSATTVSVPGTLGVAGTSETVGALSGDGSILLIDAGTLGINAFTNAVFSGGITGAGTVIKEGVATQTLSGALAFSGSITVENGVLDLGGAVLTGVTNIVIKSGATLTGAATVNGDLTLTFEAGGLYSGSLAVTGALSVVGPVSFAVPFNATYPFNRTVFSYASADAATLSALANAVKPSPLPSGHAATVRVTATSVRLIVAPVGTVIRLL